MLRFVLNARQHSVALRDKLAEEAIAYALRAELDVRFVPHPGSVLAEEEHQLRELEGAHLLCERPGEHGDGFAERCIAASRSEEHSGQLRVYPHGTRVLKAV